MNKFIICLLGLYGIVMLMMCFLQYYTTYSNKKKSINKAHFYMVRDFDNVLCLYLGKPLRGVDTFHSCDEGCAVEVGNCFFNFGLNPEDFENLRFEDEPVEVFLNLEN